MRGRLITVEGIEGAGKTSILPTLRRFLGAMGLPVRMTREPGGTSVGEEIRTLLLKHRAETMNLDTELLLMFAARAAHLQEVIRPALRDGVWVVSDRFTDATYAYQGGGRGVALARVAAIEEWVQGDFRPDLTLILDVPVSLGLARARQRASADRFEVEEVAFFERVRETYLALARTQPTRYRVVDAAPPLEKVQVQVGRVLEQFVSTSHG